MKGNDRVTQFLNELLTHELTAINQYFLDVKMYENWGYERLAKYFREASFDEMRDAESLMERLLYLEALPNMQRLGSVRVGETVPEKLRLALDVEVSAVEQLTSGIQLCTEVGDHGTRQILEEMVTDEEEHIDWLETELGLLDQLGENLYLAAQLDE